MAPKVNCDVDDCTNDAVQQFVVDGGHGVTVSRCADHQIPSTEWATSWVVNFPKPAEPAKPVLRTPEQPRRTLRVPPGSATTSAAKTHKPFER